MRLTWSPSSDSIRLTTPTGSYSPYFIGNDLTIGSLAVPGPVNGKDTSKRVDGCSEGSKKSSVGIMMLVVVVYIEREVHELQVVAVVPKFRKLWGT